MRYTVHSAETAPEASKETLVGAKKAFGFLPNLLGMMAEAPALVKGYVTLSGIFDSSSLTATEKQIVLITTSVENGCEYCVAAHSVIASMQKVDHAIVDALRNGKPIADAKLEALHRFTALVVKSRGWPSEQDVATFQAAGYTRANILEVVLGVSLKTMSNYANHVAGTPIDDAFVTAIWKKEAA